MVLFPSGYYPASGSTTFSAINNTIGYNLWRNFAFVTFIIEPCKPLINAIWNMGEIQIVKSWYLYNMVTKMIPNMLVTFSLTVEHLLDDFSGHIFWIKMSHMGLDFNQVFQKSFQSTGLWFCCQFSVPWLAWTDVSSLFLDFANNRWIFGGFSLKNFHPIWAEWKIVKFLHRLS